MVAVFIWLSAGVCWAQSAFDGQWNGQAGEENLTFTFATKEGGQVTGKIALQGGADMPIDWGFVKGDLIVFKVMREFQGMPRPFVYIGKVEGEQIAFGRRPEDLTLGRLREITAKRVK
jgi:hypothetical protein